MKILFRILAAVVVLFVCYALFIMFYTYSDGNRAGKLIKFSHKGFVFKTYEGDLNLGGVNTSNGGLVNNMWSFSVADDAVAAKLSSMEGKEVTLHYKEKLKTLPWRGESKYIVDSVMEVR